MDTMHAFQKPMENGGFKIRLSRFLKEMKVDKNPTTEVMTSTPEYGTKPTPLIHRLNHDLVRRDKMFLMHSIYSNCSLQAGWDGAVLPGVSVRVNLVLNKPEFVMQCPTDDDNRYRLLIKDCHIECPIAQLHDKVALQIERRLKTHPAVINFTRTSVIPYPVAKGSPYFVVDKVGI